MAKKSKTQRAKASARRAEKKEQAAALAALAEKTPAVQEEEKKGGKLFSRKAKSAEETAPAKAESKKETSAVKKQPRKEHFKFIKEVRSELKRVTWPSRQDVLRWSGVVVFALVFFSLYVFVLDNWIVTPLLLAISTLGA